jgi:hypothetical protein
MNSEENKFMPRLLANESPAIQATLINNNPPLPIAQQGQQGPQPTPSPIQPITKIKSKKVVFTIELPSELTQSIVKALVIQIPSDNYMQALAWKTRSNWGTLLRVFGHSSPSASLSGMVLQIKWKSSVGLIMLPSKGFEQFAGPIDVSDTIKIKEYLINHYINNEPRDKAPAKRKAAKKDKVAAS